ncbi:MAG: ROK family protein [Chloroflexi bacterium]|nr:ROK family protein [Chloroflexota bacterium]
MTYFIGVDLGGTNLRAALIDPASGERLAVRKMATPNRAGPAAVIDSISQLIDEVVAAGQVTREAIGGAGVGMPGLVDLDRGVALLLPNIAGNWPEVMLRDVLERRIGLPVRLINDVRAITLAEWRFGAGKGVDTMACYAIGTGIGGGVVVNGRLHLGISGSAGELGHQVVEPNGAPCNCGGRGCLEMYASGPAIAARAIQAIVQRRPTCMGELVDQDLNRITVEVVLQAARMGDEVARTIFEQAGAYLGIAVANTLLTISPRKVVVGGGVAAAGDLLLDPARRTVRERVFLMPADRVEIVPAELGNDAGLIGAALWAAGKALP